MCRLLFRIFASVLLAHVRTALINQSKLSHSPSGLYVKQKSTAPRVPVWTSRLSLNHPARFKMKLKKRLLYSIEDFTTKHQFHSLIVTTTLD